MLASNPVPSLNQNSQPLGIPYRFKTKQSRSSRLLKKSRLVAR
jgi:hypothetical protein